MRGYDRAMTRMPLVVSTLVVVALAILIVAAGLFMGLLSIGPGGVAVATTRPPASGPIATPTPVLSEPPTAEPTTDVGPTPRPTGGGTHIVQPGESLSSIGEIYGIPWLLIAEANAIPEPYIIQVGQELVIPPPDAAPTAGAGFHIVQAGESITSIAELYGVTPTELADANPDVADWNLIFVGQRLIVPDGSATPEPEASPS
jgi:LysM repeat protein